MLVHRMSEQAALNSLTKVSYLRHELTSGLNGIKFFEELVESLELCGEQRHILRKSHLCREQLAQIDDDTDIESIEQCYLEMKCAEFKLGESLEVVLDQVANMSRERKVEVVYEASEQVSSLSVFGDNLRVQQVLSDFLSNALNFTSEFEGSSVLFRVTHKMERIGAKVQVAHLKFRITHPTPGIPEKLIKDMFHTSRSMNPNLLMHVMEHEKLSTISLVTPSISIKISPPQFNLAAATTPSYSIQSRQQEVDRYVTYNQ